MLTNWYIPAGMELLPFLRKILHFLTEWYIPTGGIQNESSTWLIISIIDDTHEEFLAVFGLL